MDLAALERLIVRFSYLITEQSWIKEIDINPLLASPDGLLALDARVVLHPADVSHSTAARDSAVPDAIRPALEVSGRRRGPDSPDSAGRRADDRAIPRATVGAQHLFALFSLD